MFTLVLKHESEVVNNRSIGQLLVLKSISREVDVGVPNR